MDPYNQGPAPSSGQDPYHFIMNTQHTPKKGLLPKPGRGLFKSPIIMVAVGGTLLVILLVVVLSILSGNKEKGAQSLITLLGEQQEIIRISDIGLKTLTDSSTKNYAETVRLSVISDQTELRTYLTKRGSKITPIQLAAKKNTKTDTVFADAVKNNRIDDVYTVTIKEHLKAYQSLLDSSYAALTTPIAKELVKESFTSTSALLK